VIDAPASTTLPAASHPLRRHQPEPDVGPGRSHFAGPGNPFYRLLRAAGLVPEPLTFVDDVRLPEFGLALTNIAERVTREAAELRAADYARGRRRLARTIATIRPAVAVFVGSTAYRQFFGPSASGGAGAKPERIAGAAVFVVPNPAAATPPIRGSWTSSDGTAGSTAGPISRRIASPPGARGARQPRRRAAPGSGHPSQRLATRAGRRDRARQTRTRGTLPGPSPGSVQATETGPRTADRIESSRPVSGRRPSPSASAR
jgi:G:T/U-mismatch repair DNA glycosylase